VPPPSSATTKQCHHQACVADMKAKAL